jgi:hypothetical protein
MAETLTSQPKRKPERAIDSPNTGETDQPKANPLRRAYKRLMGLPRNFRLAALALLLFVVGAVLFTRWFSDPAKVTIVCQHYFRVAQLSVWADDDLIYSGKVNGTSKSHLAFLGGSKAVGLHKIIDVPAGQHSIRVRLTSDADGYDQIKTVAANFGDSGENSVSVSVGRHGLSVVTQGSPIVAEDSGIVSSSRKLASSVLLSIFGSGMSAAIAFLVQEFLRAQKTRLVAPPTEVKG